MPECSKRYLDLVKTRTGLTPTEPWRSKLGVSMPSPVEYEEWHNLATELTEAAYRHFTVLGDIETRKSDGKHHPKWNEIVGDMNDLRAAEDSLPSFLGALWSADASWLGDTERAIRVATQAACLMERVDLAIESYDAEVPWSGVTPKADDEPDKPSSTFSFFSDIWGLAIGAGVMYGAYLLIQAGGKDDE